MKMVKVSVIVPVYNVEDYLEKCLDSVIGQTFEDIEIICVNDGSTDNSLDILNEYEKKDNRIKVISQENAGLAEARNVGMKHACGEYLLFLDSDDWLELECIEELYANAKNNDSDMVLFNSIEIKENNQTRERIYIKPKKNEKIDFDNFSFDYSFKKRLVMNSLFVVWSKFYKTSFLKENKIEFKDFRLFEDVPFHIETMIRAERISYLPKVLHNYNRLNLKSLQNSKNSLNKRLILFDIFNDVEEFLKNNDFYGEFEPEFLEFKIGQSLVNFNLTQEEFKEEFYKTMREEFIKMNLDSNILKKLPFDKYRSYIHILNFDSLYKYNTFNKNIKYSVAYINKREISKEMEKFNEMGISSEIPDDCSQNGNRQLIVSLTSFPERMVDIDYCIFSILNQSLKPNKIVLWLAEEQFPRKERDIPESVLRLKEFGLTIKWCNDIKSFKKLIPSLKEYPNDYIVTADDDLYYPKDWLENIWKQHLKYPDAIIASIARKMSVDDDNHLCKYVQSKLIDSEEEPSYMNFPVCGGGTLFYRGFLSEKIYDEELFTELCPTVDDIWFWAMGILNGTKVSVIEKPIPNISKINLARHINILDYSNLWKENQLGRNDIQMANVLNHFNEIYDIINGD